MSKKSKIILGSAFAVFGLGVFSSLFIDWPVDFSDADGDIAKASRFSREQASEKLTNMEELLQTDSAFKDGIVAAQYVMQTRALQFGSLVDMSNEVAGEIPAFADVLKDMNTNREMVNNVVNSLSESGQNLNAALDGEKCADLEQTTINASLAYTTLQKQNKLATRFIETTDKYLETAQGDDRLKFVRDQWVDYQKMTAALDGDNAAAEALAKKGNLLSGEKTLAAMADFGIAQKVTMVNSAFMTKNMEIDGSLAKALPGEALEAVVTKVRSAAEIYSNTQGAEAMNSMKVAKFNQTVSEAINQAVIVANNRQTMVGQRQTMVGQRQAMVGQRQTTLDLKKGVSSVVFNQAVQMIGSTGKVVEAYTNAVNSAQKVASRQEGLSNRVGDVIKSTAAGNMPTLGSRIPW